MTLYSKQNESYQDRQETAAVICWLCDRQQVTSLFQALAIMLSEMVTVVPTHRLPVRAEFDSPYNVLSKMPDTEKVLNKH